MKDAADSNAGGEVAGDFLEHTRGIDPAELGAEVTGGGGDLHRERSLPVQEGAVAVGIEDLSPAGKHHTRGQLLGRAGRLLGQGSKEAAQDEGHEAGHEEGRQVDPDAGKRQAPAALLLQQANEDARTSGEKAEEGGHHAEEADDGDPADQEGGHAKHQAGDAQGEERVSRQGRSRPPAVAWGRIPETRPGGLGRDAERARRAGGREDSPAGGTSQGQAGPLLGQE